MYKTLNEIQQDSNVENKKLENMTCKELRTYIAKLRAALAGEKDYYDWSDDMYDKYYFNFIDYTMKELEEECAWMRENVYIFLTPEQKPLVAHEFHECKEEIVKRAKHIAKHTDLSEYISYEKRNFCKCPISLWNEDSMDDYWKNIKSKDQAYFPVYDFIANCLDIIERSAINK